MRRLVMVFVAVAVGVLAQTPLYNPSWIEFESVDHSTVTSYVVEVVVNGTTQIISQTTVPTAQVQSVAGTTPQRYRISFDLLEAVPTGKMYRYQVRAVAPNGAAVSEQAPEFVRFSPCVSGSGVQPITVALGTVPTLKVGEAAQIQVTVTSPEPVYRVSLDLMNDGQPAWYFVSKSDLRGTKSYSIGPFVRAGSSFVTLEALGANGCTATVTSQMVTVVP